MNLRRHLAALIDPDMDDEIADLRDRNVEAVLKVQALRQIVRHLHAERHHITTELATARADVERLLEAAARCAHEHHDSTS